MLQNNGFSVGAQDQAGNYQGNFQAQIDALNEKIERLIRTHLHDGNGAQSIRGSTDIVGPAGMIVGIGTMSGGILDIKDGRIKDGSAGVCMRYNSSDNDYTVYKISGGYSAPGVYRFFEGSFSKTWQIVYCIVP